MWKRIKSWFHRNKTEVCDKLASSVNAVAFLTEGLTTVTVISIGISTANPALVAFGVFAGLTMMVSHGYAALRLWNL